MKSRDLLWIVILGLLALLGFTFFSRRATGAPATNEFGAPLNASPGSPFGFLAPLFSNDGGKPHVTGAAASGAKGNAGSSAGVEFDLTKFGKGLFDAIKGVFLGRPDVRLDSPGPAPGALIGGRNFNRGVAAFDRAAAGPANAGAANHPGIPNRNFALDDPADPVFTPGVQGGIGFGPGGFYEVGGV